MEIANRELLLAAVDFDTAVTTFRKKARLREGSLMWRACSLRRRRQRYGIILYAGDRFASKVGQKEAALRAASRVHVVCEFLNRGAHIFGWTEATKKNAEALEG